MRTAVLSRQNLFQDLFSLLILLVVVCYTCESVHADSLVQPNTVKLFEPLTTKVPENVGDQISVKDVKSFETPSFVSSHGVMVVFASSEYIEKCDDNVDIVARYIRTEGIDWARKVTTENGNNWNTQLAMQPKKKWGYISQLRRPVAVARGDKIYLLALHHEERKKEPDSLMSANWFFEMSIGEVKPIYDAKGTGVTIEWKKLGSPIANLTEEVKDHLLSVPLYGGGGGGYGFLTEDGKIMFIMQALLGNKDVFVITYLNDTGKEIELDWFYVDVPQGCYFPYVFGWKKKLIMVTTYCRCGGLNVKESTDMGRTWTDAVGSISRLWDNLQNTRDFTTVIIENKSVILFTQLRNRGIHMEPRYAIHLWLTDGKRLHDMGPIVSDYDLNFVVSSGLLYTNGELFSLHQTWKNDVPENTFLTHLKDKLESIKSVLKTWVEIDEYLSKPCNETTPQSVSTETLCVTPMPTDGLIGFLSDKGSATTWEDKYLYVNATVRRGTKVKKGFTFHGAGSGAKWTLGEQWQSHRYNFAKYGLTVVATVIIHEVPRGDSPLLTFDGIWAEQRLGLWYNERQQWKIKLKNVGMPGGFWGTNKTHRVALVRQNTSLSAYVDGKPVGALFYVSAPGEYLFDIEHLFIGRYEEENVKDRVGHVTVTDVFLYNRAFSDAELQALGEKRRSSNDI